jgi:hypothetical protein
MTHTSHEHSLIVVAVVATEKTLPRARRDKKRTRLWPQSGSRAAQSQRMGAQEREKARGAHAAFVAETGWSVLEVCLAFETYFASARYLSKTIVGIERNISSEIHIRCSCNEREERPERD